MRYRPALLHKIAVFLLFLVLQGIALWFIARNSVYQQAGMLRLLHAGRNLIWEYQANISNYFKLKTINDELAAENIRLRTALLAQSESGPSVVTDSLFAFIDAEVVYNSTYKLQNYLVINKGSAQGIAPDMGVIGDRSVVGIVASVGKHYALVISLLNTRFQVSARVGPEEAIGSLSWDGKHIRTASISDMPQHSRVTAGDTVVTSGFSQIFPARIPLGTVMATTIKKGTYMDAQIELFQNFNTLRHVHVIRSLYAGEIKALLQDYE